MNRPHRLLSTLLSVLFLSFLLASSQAQTTPGQSETRTGGLDVVLLLDKSLSMAPYFDQVKAYVAGRVLEPILVPGDRLILETFYGKVDRLFGGPIATEQDKAAAIRELRSVKADGRFTDIGAALDAAQRDLTELGQPDRPKYVLLITDERQEAPAGSPYVSPNHKLSHPALQYMKRVDLGKFRAITVGFGVGAKVDATAPQVMRLLTEAPPSAAAGPAAGGSPGAAAGGAGQSSGAAPGGDGAAGGSPGLAATAATGGGTGIPGLPAFILWIGLAVLLLLLGLGTLLILRSRKPQDRDQQPS
ncbi:MAG TPA: vWA domain-containing protein [Rectinemataceae bacterium]|nr:vWA domain-containing protein [Rectinemataceae bacterium]